MPLTTNPADLARSVGLVHPDDQALRDEDAACLLEPLLRRLCARHRQVIRTVWSHGCDHAAAASTLGIARYELLAILGSAIARLRVTSDSRQRSGHGIYDALPAPRPGDGHVEWRAPSLAQCIRLRASRTPIICS